MDITKNFISKSNKQEAFIMDLLSLSDEQIGKMDVDQLKRGFKSMQVELAKKIKLNLGNEVQKAWLGNQLKEQTAKTSQQAALAKFYQMALEHTKTEKASYMLHLGVTKDELFEANELCNGFERKNKRLLKQCEEKSAELNLLKSELTAITEKSQSDLTQMQKMLNEANSSIESVKAEHSSMISKNESKSFIADKNIQFQNCQLLKVIEDKSKSSSDYFSEPSSESTSDDDEIQISPKNGLPAIKKPIDSPTSFIKTSQLFDDVSNNAADAAHQKPSQKVVKDAKKKNSALVKRKTKTRYTVIFTCNSF